MTFIAGELINFRGFERTDLPLYREWLNDKEVTRYLEMGVRPLSDSDLENIYVAHAEAAENVAFIIVDKESGRAIGTTGIWAINWPCRRGDFRILIGDPAYFSRGFGTEATRQMVWYGFEWLNLETITLGFNAENEAARKAYERAGFTYEGRRRQMIYRDSRYYDIDQMSILRSEYEAQKTAS
ncbi:MAG: GNAT family protein [Pseudomonadota bacterium]|nr:GNAT family protein [Pseudomonadota bacterium]